MRVIKAISLFLATVLMVGCMPIQSFAVVADFSTVSDKLMSESADRVDKNTSNSECDAASSTEELIEPEFKLEDAEPESEIGDSSTTTDISALSEAAEPQADSIVQVVRTLAQGSYHSGVIDSNAKLYTWGWNGNGQLGDNTSTSKSTPISILSGVKQVSSGISSSYTMAIKADNSLWAWGYNDGADMLGLGNGWPTYTPTKVMDGVSSISNGSYHSLAIKTDKSLWAWGSNSWGQLGNGTTTKSSAFRLMSDVESVSAGDHHSMVIKSDMTLWGWGSNDVGQIGNGQKGNKILSPQKIMSNVIQVSAGRNRTAAIKTDGSLWEWGAVNYTVGGGTGAVYTRPVKIMDNAAYVSVGGDYVLAIKKDGTLWSWGGNGCGQLGYTVGFQAAPKKVLDNVAFASAGLFHSLAIKKDGTLWSWGNNSVGGVSGDGVLGVGNIGAFTSTPQRVMGNAKIPSGIAYNPPSSTPMLSFKAKTQTKTVGTLFNVEPSYTANNKTSLLPLYGTGQTWSSSNTSVATISDSRSGLVRAVKAGTTKITVKYNGLSASYDLTVKSASITPKEEKLYVNAIKGATLYTEQSILVPLQVIPYGEQVTVTDGGLKTYIGSSPYRKATYGKKSGLILERVLQATKPAPIKPNTVTILDGIVKSLGAQLPGVVNYPAPKNCGYLRAECTWYASERFNETHGFYLSNSSLGDGGRWFGAFSPKTINGKSVKKISWEEAKKQRFIPNRSVLSMSGGSYGHVVFIEAYDPEKKIVYYSEANRSITYYKQLNDQWTWRSSANYKDKRAGKQTVYNIYDVQTFDGFSLGDGQVDFSDGLVLEMHEDEFWSKCIVPIYKNVGFIYVDEPDSYAVQGMSDDQTVPTAETDDKEAEHYVIKALDDEDNLLEVYHGELFDLNVIQLPAIAKRVVFESIKATMQNVVVEVMSSEEMYQIGDTIDFDEDILSVDVFMHDFLSSSTDIISSEHVFSFVRAIPSEDANINALEYYEIDDDGVLIQQDGNHLNLNEEDLQYTVPVHPRTKHVDLLPTLSDSNAQYIIKGKNGENLDGFIPLVGPSTTITISVLAEMGNTCDYVVHFEKSSEDDFTNATEITLMNERSKLAVDDILLLTPTVIPDNAINKKVVYSSDNTDVATVDTVGYVTGLKTGTAVITAALESNRAIHVSCEVTVYEELISIALSPQSATMDVGETKRIHVATTPSHFSAPDDLDFRVIGNDSVITIKENPDGKSVDVTAIGNGTATVMVSGTVDGNDNSPFLATCKITVAAQPSNVILITSPSPLVLAPGEKGSLVAAVEPTDANQIVTWESGDEDIVVASPTDINTADVIAVSAGKTVIYATTENGDVYDYCQVTVENRQGVLYVSRSHLVLINGASDIIKFGTNVQNDSLKFILKNAVTYEEVDWSTKVSIDKSVEKQIKITPKDDSDGQYILRINNSGLATRNMWAECRIDIATTPLSGAPDYPIYRLGTASITVSKKQTLNATASQIGLWPNADAATPVSLMSTGVKVQFKGGDANPNNAFFAFIPSDENTVDVQIKSIAGIGKKYQDELEIILPNDDPVTIEGKLTINVTDKPPTLKATAVTVNTFYDDRTAEILITGGMVEQLKESSNNKLAWARIDEIASNWTVTVDDMPSKGSGTLKLDAKLTGWEGWYPVNVKVHRTYVPPALKLASNKISLYMSTTRAMDNTLVLQPKNSGTTLASLGITRIDVDSSKAGIFNVKNYSFNVRTGKFVIHADRAKPESQLKGTLPLLVSVKGASKYKVKLNASVSLVKSSAAVKLKASKTSLTLNPNLVTGESYDISLSTNVPGFDLVSWHDQNPIGVHVFDSTDKAKVKTNVNGQPGKITASVGDDGNTLTVSVCKGADFGRTYKVLLTLPNVNDKKPVSPTLTLTIKTTKESTSTVVTSKNYYGAKGTISVKGKMDLSTGTRATITAKLTNYNGGVLGGDLNNSIPDFEITPPKTVSNTAWGPNSDEYKDNFLFRRVSPTSWTVELKKGGSLVPGTYTIAMKTGYINDIDSISSKAVRFTVSAAKPKVTLSTKKVTLYNNDPGSRGVVTLTLPNGYADIANVTLKGAKLADGKTNNPSFAYKIQQLDSNTYAIMLDQSKNAAVLDSVNKSASVTLEVWLVGNDNTKSVATAKVTVAVNKGH